MGMGSKTYENNLKDCKSYFSNNTKWFGDPNANSSYERYNSKDKDCDEPGAILKWRFPGYRLPGTPLEDPKLITDENEITDLPPNAKMFRDAQKAKSGTMMLGFNK